VTVLSTQEPRKKSLYAVGRYGYKVQRLLSV
jgi:hypothetical protein